MLKLPLCLIPLIFISSCSVSNSSVVPPKPQLTPQLTQPSSLNLALTLAPIQSGTLPTQAQIEEFVKKLTDDGYNPTTQGIWIQSGNTLLANYRGTIPLPAASIAKVATTLVALERFNPDHQFTTDFGMTGTIKDGVLYGDLIVKGGDDPFFVWENAIAVGNLLNEMGIKRVTGDLIIVNSFYMNFKLSPLESGTLLKVGLNSQNWTKEAQTQYKTLPPVTPRPQVIIEGSVKTIATTPSNLKPLLSHHSLPLAELLKKMNLYSNTWMTKMINQALGGDSIVAQKAAQLAQVPTTEIQLGGSDRISPRAAVGMFLAIEQYLQQYNMTVADVFAIIGQDEGILEKRPLPAYAVLKSGIWENISALAGALPTQHQDTIWFAIMNVGQPWEQSEVEQEQLLSELVNKWGKVVTAPSQLKPLSSRVNYKSSLIKHEQN
ncbi:peptidase S13 D-Ala-D-Ala carboxypeptidase C [Gloeothece citriformis PCC 7424]|uniref:Peptidase S13 D-Ala-D-Ala carboxypeptidase C n=1 Tax=Gloeothece citriformis (strain PCC 7424) TaxID=65393 RepID=B7KEG2_GLOC7|nr:D-alanyl-D-alanine carboxypeptidase [Gloeothece citriformis]ACK73280.1 peptidase S13 D-Ala-D-Ala carboxypeptidase C [Gloeothece citriformis PCC 7424]